MAEFNIQLCEEEPKEEGEAEPLRDGAVFALYLAKSCKKIIVDFTHSHLL